MGSVCFSYYFGGVRLPVNSNVLCLWAKYSGADDSEERNVGE